MVGVGKFIALTIVAAGLLVWVGGLLFANQRVQVAVPTTQLSAAAIQIPGAEYGSFNQAGTILLDPAGEPGGTPFLLYTEYDANNRPQIKTKRLVFSHRDTCSDLGLPCATNQPGVPVRAEEEVRIIGVVKNELVEVHEIHRMGQTL